MDKTNIHNKYYLPSIIYSPLAELKKNLIYFICKINLRYFYKLRKIGKEVVYEKGFRIFNGAHNIIIGNNVYLSDLLINAGDSREGEVIISDNVFFGHRCMLLARTHDYKHKDIIRQKKITTKKIIIKQGVWIASGSIILCGVTIEKNSVIAAGAVVTRDVPANKIYGGVPARFIKNI